MPVKSSRVRPKTRNPWVLATVLLALLIVVGGGIAAHEVGVARRHARILVLFDQAQSQLHESDWAAARDTLATLLGLVPHSPTALKLMGDSYRDEPQREDGGERAKMYYLRALDISPGYVGAFSALREVIYRQHDGTAGVILDDGELNELQARIDGLKTAGSNVPGEADTCLVFACSYASAERYDLAVKWADRACRLVDNGADQTNNSLHYSSVIRDQYEWLRDNANTANGNIEIHWRDGDSPSGLASIAASIQDGSLVWRGYFKGPVECYDRESDRHAIIYVPKNDYEWPTALAADGDVVWIGSANCGRLMRYNKITSNVRTFQVNDVPGIDSIRVSDTVILINADRLFRKPE